VISSLTQADLQRSLTGAEELEVGLAALLDLFESPDQQRGALLDQVRQLLAKQQALREDTSLRPDAAGQQKALHLADRQLQLATEIERHVPRTTSVDGALDPAADTSSASSRNGDLASVSAPMSQAAQAARQAAEQLFAHRPDAVSAAQETVLHHLGEVEQQLDQRPQDDQQGNQQRLDSQASPVELAQRGRHLQQQRQRIDQIVHQGLPAIDHATAGSSEAQASSDRLSQLAAELADVAQQAQRDAPAAADRLREAASMVQPPPVVEPMARQSRSNESNTPPDLSEQMQQARNELVSAMIELRRRQLALVVGTGGRITEVLERVAAQQRRLAETSQWSDVALSALVAQHQQSARVLSAAAENLRGDLGIDAHATETSAQQLSEMERYWRQPTRLVDDLPWRQAWQSEAMAQAAQISTTAQLLRGALQRAATELVELAARRPVERPSQAAEHERRQTQLLLQAIEQQISLRTTLQSLIDRPMQELTALARDPQDTGARTPVTPERAADLERWAEQFAAQLESAGALCGELAGVRQIQRASIRTMLDTGSLLRPCHATIDLPAEKQRAEIPGTQREQSADLQAVYALGHGYLPASPLVTARAMAGLPLPEGSSSNASFQSPQEANSSTNGSTGDGRRAAGSDSDTGREQGRHGSQAAAGASSGRDDSHTGNENNRGSASEENELEGAQAGGTNEGSVPADPADPAAPGSLGTGQRGTPEGAASRAPDPVGDPWVAALPPGVREAVRAAGREPPPARYQETLRRYFSRIRTSGAAARRSTQPTLGAER
jgi:hypothetical protein